MTANLKNKWEKQFVCKSWMCAETKGLHDKVEQMKICVFGYYHAITRFCLCKPYLRWVPNVLNRWILCLLNWGLVTLRSGDIKGCITLSERQVTLRIKWHWGSSEVRESGTSLIRRGEIIWFFHLLYFVSLFNQQISSCRMCFRAAILRFCDSLNLKFTWLILVQGWWGKKTLMKDVFSEHKPYF